MGQPHLLHRHEVGPFLSRSSAARMGCVARPYFSSGTNPYVTYATFLLSGDHDGTLIVPCPPKNFASTEIFLSASDISRSITSLFSGWPVTSAPYVRNT